jgi:hypothetical protein
MRTRIMKALLATAAAGATITSLSFAAAGPASAAQLPDVLNNNASGWSVGNVLAPSLIRTSSTWRFRYSSGTTSVPDATNPVLAVNITHEAFSSQLSNARATFSAQLFWNGTAWTQRFIESFLTGGAPTDHTPLSCTHTWATGSTARMDVFYSQDQGSITFTAYDGTAVVCQATVAAWDPGSTGGGPFSEGFVGGIFGTAGNPYADATTTWTRPTGAGFADTRLFAVSGVRETSYNGTMGTIVGPWPYQQLIFGSSAANVFVSSPVLWNGGANFGVWVRV